MKQAQPTTGPLIVGVGASAGGLEAFQELLRSLRDEKNFAIVYVQHLEKETDGLLVELLAKSTAFNVTRVSGNRKLKAGNIYVCPPWTFLELKNSTLKAAKSERNERPSAPIDFFFNRLPMIKVTEVSE